MTNNTAILVVSFGTGFNESRRLTIGAIEDAIARAFPNYDVRRALAGQEVINRIKERDGLAIDNIKEALERAANDGITRVVVLPTYLVDGYEYGNLEDTLKLYGNYYQQIALGKPLLSDDTDFDAVIKAMTGKTASFDDGKTAICFVGHGTRAKSNRVYAKMQMKLKHQGFNNYYIGTIKAEPSLSDVVALLEEKGCYHKVVLAPLMVSAGGHACYDMAGNKQESWKIALERKGYEVTCILEGLGQNAAIQEIYVEHTRRALYIIK